jgi:serine/threonine protein kinase
MQEKHCSNEDTSEECIQSRSLLVIDLYDVGARLTENARGSGGEVLKCLRISDGLEFALKRISRHRSHEDISQVIILNRLDHRNIIKIVDWFEDFDHLHIVMELAKGGDLCERIISRKRISECDAVVVFGQLLSAVGYIHRANIIHCDIKPENILFMSPDGGDIKLCDFGFAQVVDHGCKVLKHHGTATYSAPEIIDGRSFDAKADMWSLGVLLYAMLAGFAPFGQRNGARQTERIRKGELDFNHEVFRDVSADAVDLIRRLVVVEPSKRLSAEEALRHRWIARSVLVEDGGVYFVADNRAN